MKNKILSLLIFCTIFLQQCNCHKDAVPPDPASQLPPATQTGANTFGCLVNGQVFIPGGSSLAWPILECTYQYIYTSSENGFVLGLSANKRLWDGGSLTLPNCDNETAIGFTLDSMIVEEGHSYILKSRAEGNASADFSLIGQCYGFEEDITSNTLGGTITFTRFDETNQIASGTFEFNVFDTTRNDTIKITDGRFDVHFTR